MRVPIGTLLRQLLHDREVPMNAFDRQFQPGSTFLIVLFSALVVLFSVAAVAAREQRPVSLLLVFLALNEVWKHHKIRAGHPRNASA